MVLTAYSNTNRGESTSVREASLPVIIAIGGFGVELLERIFLDGGWGVAKCLNISGCPLTGLPGATDSNDTGSEGARADVPGVKGIITAVGASDGGVGECAVELVDSTSPNVQEDARNDARNLRMLVICQLV